MPTNQFCPWTGGELRACTTADGPPAAAPVSDVPTKVPYSQNSLTSDPKNSSGRNHGGDASSCYEDLLIQGHASEPLSSTQDTADGFSSPPPLCLHLCTNQEVTPLKKTSSYNNTKVEGSTQRPAKAARRSISAKIKLCRTQNLQETHVSTDVQLLVEGVPPAEATDVQLLVEGVPPAEAADVQLLVEGVPPAEATDTRPHVGASLHGTRHTSEGPCPLGTSRAACPSLSSSTPAGMKTAQHLQSTQLDVGEDVASCPAGALVGSVTSQISTIHLTKQGPSSSSPSSLSSSTSPTEEHVVGEAQQSGSECLMQVDEVEDEQQDEQENTSSDDDDSDASSTASAPLLCSVKEPMILEAHDDREERPALIPSLFPLTPPTLYFSTAHEKVELLPAEERRLLKWKMSSVTPVVVKHTIDRSHFTVTKKSHDWLGCWGHHSRSPGFKALGKHQKLNHFPGTFQIGRKDRLWRNLSKMQLQFGKQEFNFIPQTFILPRDIKLLRSAWVDSGSKQKWIVKPPASARGTGIQVIHKWSQMPRKRPLLVQKYLHKPYLIGGNKFDLRIYVYVTSYNPLRVYMFSDGLVRFASCKYSSSSKTLSNKFMHLTNYSVNKKNSEYQTNSDDKACQGHKWALKALWQHLGSKGVNTTQIWDKIKDIVIKTVIASEPYVNNQLKMHVKTSYSCHELFGFDIMLDKNLKPWILEVNISPSLHSNSALDVSIKGQMIRDLLNLAGFRIPTREEETSICSSSSSSTSSLCGGPREWSGADGCVDEKRKQSFFTSQRFADQDVLSSVLDVLTPEDVCTLAETEDELSRRGEFERVFPSPSSSRYLRFFRCLRYNNILLDQWEQRFWKDRSAAIHILRSLCEKGVHLGTNNSAHKWSESSSAGSGPQGPAETSPSRSRVLVQLHSEEISSDDASVPGPGASGTSSTCGSPQNLTLL